MEITGVRILMILIQKITLEEEGTLNILHCLQEQSLKRFQQIIKKTKESN